MWIEWLCDRLPMIGSTLRAIDLAEMSESVFVSIASGDDYPSAFRAASRSTRSQMLARWTSRAAERLAAGESLHGIARTMPMRGEFISGVLGAFSGGNTFTTAHALWRETSERMHELMLRRGSQLQLVLAPVLVVVALLAASFAMLLSLSSLYKIVELISGLT